MPLENGEWRETTPEDLKAFAASLEGSLQEVTMTPELMARLEAGMRPANPLGLSVLVEGNKRLYPTLAGLVHKGFGSVDIVVPVYNAWHITRRCLEAVYTRTMPWPSQVYVVDDASDEFTRSKLERWGIVHLIRNEKNRGFAASVNRGIRAGTGEYVCLLNSDVLVTPGWLTKMILALHSDPRNAIVCPATNNTAVVEIPMSPGASYLHMADAFEGFAQRRYPEIMPTGFCFMFRRSLLEEVGYFDEAFRFAGEESDFWWKCIQKGYRAVMADDTYVFHERASSSSALGKEADNALRKAAGARFGSLHPEWVEWRDQYDVSKALGPLRVPVPPSLLRSPRDLYRVCWVVYDARACGAMRYIADLCNEMCERGINAKVVVLKRDPEHREEWLGELRQAPVYFNSQAELQEDFAQRVFPAGLVIASTVELAPAVRALVDASGGALRGCLHAQSFEPALTKEPAEIAHLQALYQLLPDVISSSNWVAQEIAALGPPPFATVHPGVDRTLFYPRDRSAGDERPTVCIPMNPSVWWRGWDRGLELIQALEKAAGDLDLRILVYGVDSLPIVSRAVCLGVLTQARLAHVLGTEVDILIDPSHVHSYGMPVLEAAACGITSLSWDNRGARELELGMVEGGMDEMCQGVSAIFEMRMHLYGTGHPRMPIVPQLVERFHDRERSCSAFIEAIETHFKLRRKLLRICVVAPHLRKWGGPTTMLHIAHELARRGHRVQVATVYPDVAPDIAAMAEVPIRMAPKALPEADLYITNSDNPWVEEISALPAKRILLKLSHNPRFKAEEERGLRQEWDAIVTSTEWLVRVCGEPLEGWKHGPRYADAIGWWHYEHARFRCPPSERTYGDGSAEKPFVIGTLVHAHPTKGTQEALEVIAKRPLGYHYRIVGVGEVPPRAVRLPEGIEYVYQPSRDQMAALFKQMDVWVSASKSEGLGRMSLEAMSAGCAVVARDTGSEQLACVARYDKDGAETLYHVLSVPLFTEELRNRAFALAERAADPDPCINALENVIAQVCS